MKLWMKILIALVFGVIAGVLLGPQASNVFKPIGSIFLNLINMIVMPLVLSSIIVSITNIRDFKQLGRVGLTTFGIFLLTTFAAIIIGLVFASVLRPWLGYESTSH